MLQVHRLHFSSSQRQGRSCIWLRNAAETWQAAQKPDFSTLLSFAALLGSAYRIQLRAVGGSHTDCGLPQLLTGRNKGWKLLLWPAEDELLTWYVCWWGEKRKERGEKADENIHRKRFINPTLSWITPKEREVLCFFLKGTAPTYVAEKLSNTSGLTPLQLPWLVRASESSFKEDSL